MTRARAWATVSVGVMAWPAVAVALVSAARATVPRLVDGSAGVDDALTAVAAILGLAVFGWLTLATLATVAAALLPRGAFGASLTARLGRAVTPVVLRRLLSVVIAGALVTGASPAQASARGAGPSAAAPPRPAATAPAVAGSVDPGSLDPAWAAPATTVARVTAATAGTRTITRPGAEALDPSWGGPGRARPTAYPDDLVVVRRGDTLWDITARHLGPAATDAEIAHAWPHWFTANRAAIGPDPDRLVPGQRLQPPAPRTGGLS